MKLLQIFIFSLFISLIACTKNDKFENNIIKSMNNTTLNLDQQIRHDLRLAKSILADKMKTKYAEIIPALDSISYYFLDLKNAARNLRHDIAERTDSKPNIKVAITAIDNKLEGTKKGVNRIYERLLNNQGERFGLRPVEIKNLIEKRQTSVDSLLSLDFQGTSDASKSEMLVLLAKFEMDVTTHYHKTVEEVSWMMGGRANRLFFSIFPIIIPKQNCLKKGDKFEASIGIIDDESYFFSPDDVQLSVDGKSLRFEKGWHTNFKTEPLFKSKTIKISCEIYDELTGKMMPAFREFEYKIQLDCSQNINEN